MLRRIHRPTLVSFGIAGSLVLVGVVRVLSYFPGWIEGSALDALAYRPDDLHSVRYFKILASPSVVGLLYFVFRLLNRGHRSVFPEGHVSSHRDLDFASPWVRIVLLGTVNAHWVLTEWYKFTTHDYPYSPLEDWRANVIVLAASSLIAFLGMKHLSFDPLLERPSLDRRRAACTRLPSTYRRAIYGGQRCPRRPWKSRT